MSAKVAENSACYYTQISAVTKGTKFRSLAAFFGKDGSSEIVTTKTSEHP